MGGSKSNCNDKDSSFRSELRERLLGELVGARNGTAPGWKVLVVDEMTVRVLGRLYKASDLSSEGVSLVEALGKRRQPMPHLDAVYFIQPTQSNLEQLRRDMRGEASPLCEASQGEGDASQRGSQAKGKMRRLLPGRRNIQVKEECSSRPGGSGGHEVMYRAAQVHLSRPLECEAAQDRGLREELRRWEGDALLESRVCGLLQPAAALEALAVDRQGFVTGHSDALQLLFGEGIDYGIRARTVSEIAARLSTVFTFLNELPLVRYMGGKGGRKPTPGVGHTSHELRGSGVSQHVLPAELAAALQERLLKCTAKLPQRDTCDLLIVDRTIDPVAPVIHDWHYGGMVYDLLPMDGDKYEYSAEFNDGRREKKTVVLDEDDPVWLELRDLFFPEAIERLAELGGQAVAREKAGKGELSVSDMQQVLQNKVRYGTLDEKTASHTNMCSELRARSSREGLLAVGALEQGMVSDSKGCLRKDLEKLLMEQGDALSPYAKLRLLLVYAAKNPGQVDQAALENWISLAQLGPRDTAALLSLELLGVPLPAAAADGRQSGGLSVGGWLRAIGLNFEGAHRHKCCNEDGPLLRTFQPLIQDVLEALHHGSLSPEEYPFITSQRSYASASPPPAEVDESSSGLARWAQRRSNRDSESPVASASGGSMEHLSAATGARRMGRATEAKSRRLFIFIIGGMTRSEIRIAHCLSKNFNREVVIGSTSLDTPLEFVEKLKALKD